MFCRETDGRHATIQHCVLAGFVASHLLIHFHRVSVEIFQQCLGDFSKHEGILDSSISVLLLPWKCPLMGKVCKDWPTRLCLSRSSHSPTGHYCGLCQQPPVRKHLSQLKKTMKEVGQFPANLNCSRSTDFYKPGTIYFS